MKSLRVIALIIMLMPHIGPTCAYGTFCFFSKLKGRLGMGNVARITRRLKSQDDRGHYLLTAFKGLSKKPVKFIEFVREISTNKTWTEEDLVALREWSWENVDLTLAQVKEVHEIFQRSQRGPKITDALFELPWGSRQWRIENGELYLSERARRITDTLGVAFEREPSVRKATENWKGALVEMIKQRLTTEEIVNIIAFALPKHNPNSESLMEIHRMTIRYDFTSAEEKKLGEVLEQTVYSKAFHQNEEHNRRYLYNAIREYSGHNRIFHPQIGWGLQNASPGIRVPVQQIEEKIASGMSRKKAIYEVLSRHASLSFTEITKLYLARPTTPLSDIEHIRSASHQVDLAPVEVRRLITSFIDTHRFSSEQIHREFRAHGWGKRRWQTNSEGHYRSRAADKVYVEIYAKLILSKKDDIERMVAQSLIDSRFTLSKAEFVQVCISLLPEGVKNYQDFKSHEIWSAIETAGLLYPLTKKEIDTIVEVGGVPVSRHWIHEGSDAVEGLLNKLESGTFLEKWTEERNAVRALEPEDFYRLFTLYHTRGKGSEESAEAFRQLSVERNLGSRILEWQWQLKRAVGGNPVPDSIFQKPWGVSEPLNFQVMPTKYGEVQFGS